MKHIFRLLLIVLLLNVSSSPLFAQWVRTWGGGYTVWSLTTSGSYVFAGTYLDGVLCSSNYGKSWTGAQSILGSSNIYALSVSGTNLFAGTDNLGVLISTDTGTSWSAVNNGLTSTNVHSLAVNGTNIFAGTVGGGVFLSTNNGANWSAVNTGLTNNRIVKLLISGANIFAGTDNGIFLSTNNGANWTAVNTGITDLSIYSLATSGTNLFAGNWDSVFFSTNNGASWAAINNNLNRGAHCLAVSGTNIFAGGLNGLINLSTNNGASWTDVTTGLSATVITSLAVSGSELIAATYCNGIWRRPLAEMITSVEQSSNNQPIQYGLEQNYPNPFNPNTTIKYRLPQSGQVTIKVYDVLGNEVKTLVNEYKPAGEYSVNFDAGKLSNGMYIYRITAGGYTSAKKMTLIK